MFGWYLSIFFLDFGAGVGVPSFARARSAAKRARPRDVIAKKSAAGGGTPAACDTLEGVSYRSDA